MVTNRKRISVLSGPRLVDATVERPHLGARGKGASYRTRKGMLSPSGRVFKPAARATYATEVTW